MLWVYFVYKIWVYCTKKNKSEVRYLGYMGRDGETMLVLKSKGVLILKSTIYLLGFKG